MELILQGIPKTQCLLDDIIVAGSSEEEHFHILEQVLERLERHNLAINMDKCAFFQTSLEFCGHRIDADGLHKTQGKIRAITEAPVPRDVSQLRAFLGLVNYYNRFLPNLANTLAPLHQLLQKNTKWCWSKECTESFAKVKNAIASDLVFTHFNPRMPLVLACDASAYSLGAVLSHTSDLGHENQ